jgi:uncharacterized membrane protein
MSVLIVLLVSFAASCGLFKVFTSDFQYLLSGNIAMCIMLCFTALAHFRFADGMTKMIPAFIPYKKVIVFVTGIFEFLSGIALLFSSIRYETGIALVIFFILILPANINAAMHNIDYQKGTTDGNGLNYLWFRIPMQLFLIGWVWFFAIYS